MTIKVIICDDHPIVRVGIKEVLSAEAGIEVIAETADGESLIAILKQHTPDVILLDISLPGRSGIDYLEQLLTINPHYKILILSMYATSQYVIRAIQMGALGYLEKNIDPAELIAAVKTVAEGEQYITKEVSNVLYKRIAGKESDEPHETLSNREYEVMLLLGQGRSNSEIAEVLQLSVKTISTYRSRIFDKLKLDNIADLVRYLIDRGLILPNK